MLEDAPGRGRWSWRRLLPGRSAPAEASDEALRGYARMALDLLAQCEALHQHWLEELDEQRRSERLANAAAVYRWYLNGLHERLVGTDAPRAVDRSHEALVAALEAAARATLLLSQGYRFHNVRRICDGGALLEDAREQAQAVQRALARLVDAAPPAALSGAEATQG